MERKSFKAFREFESTPCPQGNQFPTLWACIDRLLRAAMRARLLAPPQGTEDFESLLGRWVVGRFLFRLNQAERAERSVLNGARLLIAWKGNRAKSKCWVLIAK